MKYSQTIAIIKDIFHKACVYFTILIMLLNIGAVYLKMAMLINVDFFAPRICFMCALASLVAGIATQIFKITKIPAVSRHIAFFILIYADFFLVVIPLSSYSTNQGTTLYLSAAFFIIYFIIFGIYMGIKAAANASKNKKLKYDKVYKNVK